MSTYQRPALTDLDLANVERLIKKTPLLMYSFVSNKTQLENLRLVKLLKGLREERQLTPLKDDQDFIKCWDAIDAAIKLGQNTNALRFVLRENMRLTREILEHQKALGLTPIKAYEVRA